MKKFTRICLILAAGLLGVGFVLVIVGLCLRPDFSGMPFWRSHLGQEIREEIVDEFHWDGRWADEDTSGAETQNYEDTFTSVRSLDIEAGVTSVYLTVSDDDSFHVCGDGLSAKFECYQDEDVLKIRNDAKLFSIGKQGESILTVAIPSGAELDEVDLDIGAGTLETEWLICRELDIDCGAGSVTVNGKLSHEADISCGAGEVVLNLENAEEEFNYDLSVGVGEIVIGEKSYSGLAREKEILNHHEEDEHHGEEDEHYGSIDIDCAAGSVMISFNRTVG